MTKVLLDDPFRTIFRNKIFKCYKNKIMYVIVNESLRQNILE